MKMKLLNKLKELKNNNELILDKDYFGFLNNLKKEIIQQEDYVKNYKIEIENYNDYKKTKQNLEKLNEINELFKYIGKDNIDSLIDSIKNKMNKNNNYEINEKLEEMHIKDELAEKISNIFKNKNASYFFENNIFCILTNKKINKDILNEYNPIIFFNKEYTKVLIKRV